MASSGKKKTTMAKLMREARLRERRLDKKARKDARKQAALDPDRSSEELLDGEPLEPGEDDAPADAEAVPETVGPRPAAD